jgi:hypothetical protein
MKLKIESKVAGYYKLEAVKLDEVGKELSRRVVADWFPNLITDQGLNQMGNNSNYLNNCQVGSGSNTPAFTDTALQAFITSTASTTSRVASTLSTSPYYAQHAVVFRFAEGTAAGNLTEVGVGWSSTDGSLFSRALILDGGGSPTTITILSDETLDVSYALRFYPKLIDDIGTTVFTGNIGGSYDWIFRASEVGTDKWDMELGSNLSMGYKSPLTLCRGDIGPITGEPTLLTESISSTFLALTYVNSSLERKFSVSAGLTAGNLTGGIRSFVCNLGIGKFQLQFDPAIPKTSSDLLEFVIKHSWGRF